MTDQSEKKHSAFWGVMVIAGTVIGGGMFALPVDLAGAWFFWGAFILIISWFSMLHSGLLLLEANLNYPVGSSFNTITKDLIGNKWNIVSGITVAFVLYILTYAYISANGAIISETIRMNSGVNMNPRVIGISTAVFVACVLWFSSLAASRITSLFLGIKIIAFVIVFGSLFFQVDYSILSGTGEGGEVMQSYFPYIFMALPVCLASFGFHGSVPSIVSYMNGDIRKLRRVFVIGSAIPLIAYLFWQLVTLGSIDSITFIGLMAEHSGLNGFLVALRNVVASSHVELAVHLFADLALATSFLGVALGLFDYMADLFQRRNTVAGRLQTGAMTFLPPLAFALFYPRGFVMALGYAGVALSILALLLPSLLAWKSRQQHPQQGYRVAGGKPLLCVVFGCGVVIILVQVLIAAGMLPEVG